MESTRLINLQLHADEGDDILSAANEGGVSASSDGQQAGTVGGDAGTGDGAAQAGGQTARAFSQDDVNRIVGERLQRQERQFNERMAQIAQAFQGQTQIAPQPQTDPTQQFTQMFAQDPIGAIQEYQRAALQQQLAPMQQLLQQMAQERYINNFRATHPDFEDMRPLMEQVATQHPELANTPDPLGLAYKLARAELAEAAMQEAQKQGQADAYANIGAKFGAGGIAGGKARGQSATSEESIADDIVRAGHSFSL